MDGMGLYKALQDALNDLNQLVRDVRSSGGAYAEAERDYRIAKAKKILQLREEGFPVTITQDVAMGCDEVSALRFDRDCAEIVYKSDLEAINAKKLVIRVLESEIDRQARGA